MSELTKLSNIGKKIDEQLTAVGITTEQELREVGAQEAWLRIQGIDPSACYMRLCALEGALRGVRDYHLPDEVKQSLKAFYNAHKL